MINNLWKCFETTGDIQTYLSFKEYEYAREQHLTGIGLEDNLENGSQDKASES